MKVNNTGTKPAGTGQVRATEIEKDVKANTKQKAEVGGDLSSTKVRMSPEAQAFQKAKAIASTSTADEAKVARLQKLIDEGKYKVDAAAVSDKLVDEHLLAGD